MSSTTGRTPTRGTRSPRPSGRPRARTRIPPASPRISRRSPPPTIAVDYDGTITEQDLLQAIAYEFGDRQVVAAFDRGLDDGTITLREEIVGEYATVRAELADVLEWVFERTRIRAGFR